MICRLIVLGLLVKPIILIIVHQAHSTPGRVGQWLLHNGCTLDIRRPPIGDPLPSSLIGYAGVIVFGGPMSANDPDPWVAEEIACIERTLSADIPYLGICLGAQLLCRALGGSVTAHPDGEVEIGYYPISPTDSGIKVANSIRTPWPDHVYHWHREGFDLPRGTRCLAAGKSFPHQAFSVGKTAFGIQFHPEVTYAMMCRWTTTSADKMDHPGARIPAEHLAGWYQHDRAVNLWLGAFLNHWLKRSIDLPELEMCHGS